MKRIVIGFFLILLVESARLEAHAFLQRAEPSVGWHDPNIAERGSNPFH